MGKNTFKKWLFNHIKKICILAINVFMNHDFVFAIVGWFNRHWNFINSVFIGYPATKEYILGYFYRRHLHLMRWSPWIAGVFKHNDKWGLIIGVSSMEEDFLNPENISNLRILIERSEKIRQLLGASQKTFAGILPGVLFAKRLTRQTTEVDVTVEVVFKAEREVRNIEKYPEDVPLIILGGRGYIGKRLFKKLIEREVYCIDIHNRNVWPVHLKGKKTILINVTRNAALAQYVNLFWPDLVLLNEVYPEPTKDEVEVLTKIGSKAYHIVGVKSKSYPKFPESYAGGIPSCATWKSDNMEVIVRKLN